MSDKEKVLVGLKACYNVECGKKCPYFEYSYLCQKHLLQDAIAIIQEMSNPNYITKTEQSANEGEKTMTINEFLQKTIKSHMVNLFGKSKAYPDNRPRVVYADGFSMSVQASENHYCEPRENFLKHYDRVEIEYPSADEPLLMDYAEDPEKPTNTAYGYVLVYIIDKVIEKHGGFSNKMQDIINNFMTEKEEWNENYTNSVT